MSTPTIPQTTPHPSRLIGLALAPVLALIVFVIIPDAQFDDSGELVSGLARDGRIVAAVGTLMAMLWITEAIPVSATALIPVVLIPLLTRDQVSASAMGARYGDPLIFLFMGGFMIALAMQEWGLHRRIALRTILIVGTKPIRIVAGFMIAAAGLSMWVSNTATTVMMIPIALSVISHVQSAEPDESKTSPFTLCLLLGIAYGASIGGVATLIGTPPNAVLAGILRTEYGIDITFGRWLLIGFPLTIVLLPITWLMLTRLIYPIRLEHVGIGRHVIREQLEEQGPMSRGEWMVAIVFVTTAFLWIARSAMHDVPYLEGLTDAGIAIGAALILFALPVDLRGGVFVLSWKRAVQLPWGILLLFGGGLALATAVGSTGVAEYIAAGVSGMERAPLVLLLLIVTTIVIFLTEMTSNTATTATFVPILAAVAIGLDHDPRLLTIPAALAASCAFMMPVATPPNAIVFGSGMLTIPQMCRAGIWINAVAIGLIMLLMYAVVMPLLEMTG